MKSVIDELSLKINVKVKKDLDKTIGAIANAVNRLNRAVANVGALKNYVAQLNKISKAMLNISKSGGTQGKKKDVAPKEQPQPQTTEVPTPSDDTTSQEEQKTTSFFKRLKEKLKYRKKENKELKKHNALIKKSSSLTSKLTRAIVRIAFYRLIRSLFSNIVKGTTQGLENLRTTNAELDQTMKKWSQSTTTLYNAYATLLVPLIKTIEPIVTKLADKLANIANRQAEARAALQGQTTYSKILTSDSEEYKKNLEEANKTLLEFDKFSSLDKEDKYSGVVPAEVEMSQEAAKRAIEDYDNLINKIKEIGKVAVAILGISFVNRFISPMIKGFGSLLTSIINLGKGGSAVFDKNSGLLTSGIMALSTGIVSLIYNWRDMSSTAKALVPIIAGLAGVIAALATGLYFAKGNVAAAISVGATVTGVGLTIGSTLAAQKYADGGVPPTGTLFYAGEAGAEIVANTSGGKTGVTNIAQFKTAMVQALAEYGVAKRGTTSDTVLQINGKEFARATATDVASALGQKYRVDFQPR